MKQGGKEGVFVIAVESIFKLEEGKIDWRFPFLTLLHNRP